MKSNKLKREPKYIAKFKAFPYQQEAVDAVKDLEYAAIFHEQGLGKTKIAIDVLLYWLSKCSMDTALIVTKKQLVANWVNEFKDHTSIKPAVLNTDKNNNYRIFCGPYRVVLTNFETLETEKQQFELYLKVRNVGIIIDESAKLKNPNSKLTKTYFELAPLFQRRIIMTGTPVANRPYDIWAQIYFLDFGESLGADFNEFKKETDLSNKLSRNTDLQEEFEDNISQIFNRISSFTVRETKNSGIITLPDKVYIQEVTEFNRMQEELYERIRTELYAEVVRDGERYIDDSSAIVKRLLRLIQVTSNPKLVDEECEASAKEPLLDELIQKILANGEKCIVWSNFIENIDYFTKKYQDLGAVKIHGKMNMDARNRSVQKFHDDDIRILFATPASAKEGLTLTMANHVIFYDRGFSLDDYLQAQDRIHRISQKKTCYVHNIIIKDSIDEWVDLLLKAKGHSYHADTPEDLFYRMHLTMELGENLTEELGRKIAIFSFPMRYIPLDNDQRGFIGANWNAKYLRALQCMLIPTQGKGIQGRSFFEADFGKTAEDFVMYLAMPERLLNKRGHFVERKDEPKFEREIRYTQWSENRHLIDTWMKYYSMFEKDTVLEYIGCNRFSVETLDKIENEELKKLYFLYLTPSATIRVFSDCTEDTKRIISTFISEELPFMYSRIVETILSSKPGYKVIAGILENFGEKVCTDLLKKIDLFSGHDNDKLTMLIKANKSKRLVDFDFALLQFIPYFHVSNLLSKQEEQIIMNSAYELKEAPIRKILLLHLDELKDVLIKTNGAQPGDTQIISVIEEQIKELYHQISIFEL